MKGITYIEIKENQKQMKQKKIKMKLNKHLIHQKRVRISRISDINLPMIIK